jgi:hypothetical protein
MEQHVIASPQLCFVGHSYGKSRGERMASRAPGPTTFQWVAARSLISTYEQRPHLGRGCPPLVRLGPVGDVRASRLAQQADILSNGQHNLIMRLLNWRNSLKLLGDPDRIRTCDPLLRRQRKL